MQAVWHKGDVILHKGVEQMLRAAFGIEFNHIAVGEIISGETVAQPPDKVMPVTP